MLAEKFFLMLEALFRSRRDYPNGGPRVLSSSPHVPVSPMRTVNYAEGGALPDQGGHRDQGNRSHQPNQQMV